MFKILRMAESFEPFESEISIYFNLSHFEVQFNHCVIKCVYSNFEHSSSFFFFCQHYFLCSFLFFVSFFLFEFCIAFNVGHNNMNNVSVYTIFLSFYHSCFLSFSLFIFWLCIAYRPFSIFLIFFSVINELSISLYELWSKENDVLSANILPLGRSTSAQHPLKGWAMGLAERIVHSFEIMRTSIWNQWIVPFA